MSTSDLSDQPSAQTEKQGAAVPSDEETQTTLAEHLFETVGGAIDPRLAFEVEAVLRTSFFNSPWPPAKILSDLNAFEPGLHRELIDETRKQADHRRHLEITSVKHAHTIQDRAQRNAFIVALAGMALAGGLSLYGAPTTVAIAIVVMAIGGPNAATVLSRLIDKGK